MKTIDYYLSPMSPWTYLGHARLAEIAGRHGATIDVKPVDYGRIFPVSGGLPLSKRAPQRQAYRLAELARWRDYLGVALTVQPKFFPYESSLASRLIIAANGRGPGAALRLAGAILKACWSEERNMADEGQLANVAREQGLEPRGLMAAARSHEAQTRYDELTGEAIELQVFGAPTYVYNKELFWGQDRLEFLERALEK
ncbi:MAG TPA: 2-hydroxychromene-2-carboxylate isomerase [Burkholderiales bacterium]|jgi:carboxymethylenebutenolidase|nr:2-hydroxychromene-2-carboxylate isomerase [Burkholderiales bacterium]